MKKCKVSKEEIAANSEQREELGKNRFLLLPRDPMMKKRYCGNQAGTGGEEAALFAGDLLRMYTRYAERRAGKQKLWIPIPPISAALKK